MFKMYPAHLKFSSNIHLNKSVWSKLCELSPDLHLKGSPSLCRTIFSQEEKQTAKAITDHQIYTTPGVHFRLWAFESSISSPIPLFISLALFSSRFFIPIVCMYVWTMLLNISLNVQVEAPWDNRDNCRYGFLYKTDVYINNYHCTCKAYIFMGDCAGYYENGTSLFIVNNVFKKVISIFFIVAGAPQGILLGPLLFSIYNIWRTYT